MGLFCAVAVARSLLWVPFMGLSRVIWVSFDVFVGLFCAAAVDAQGLFCGSLLSLSISLRFSLSLSLSFSLSLSLSLFPAFDAQGDRGAR